MLRKYSFHLRRINMRHEYKNLPLSHREINAPREPHKTPLKRRILNTIGLLGLLACGAVILSACEGWEVDCSSTIEPLVSKDRTVSFNAKNYIYVDPKWSITKKNQYVNLHAERIPKLFDGLNTFLKDNDVNIQIIYDTNLQDGDEIVENADMLVADIDMYGVTGETSTYVAAIAKNDPQNIHIHWAESSTSTFQGTANRPCGSSGECNWIVITKGTHISDLFLIHEFGHYLAFDGHHPGSSNFMNDPGGYDITPTQISEIWDSVNKYRTHLWYISCKNP
jgi:hypothetical protein